MLGDNASDFYTVSYTQRQLKQLSGSSDVRQHCFRLQARDVGSNLSYLILDTSGNLTNERSVVKTKKSNTFLYVAAGAVVIALVVGTASKAGDGNTPNSNTLRITAPTPQ